VSCYYPSKKESEPFQADDNYKCIYEGVYYPSQKKSETFQAEHNVKCISGVPFGSITNVVTTLVESRGCRAGKSIIVGKHTFPHESRVLTILACGPSKFSTDIRRLGRKLEKKNSLEYIEVEFRPWSNFTVSLVNGKGEENREVAIELIKQRPIIKEDLVRPLSIEERIVEPVIFI
jgi:hypothetical protein